MAKFRRAESYYGRTRQAKENQRGNLIPGGTWQKGKTKELMLDCWWEGADLESKRFMFEGYENNRDLEDVPKGYELKDEKFLDDWWDSLEPGNRREGEGKKFIYWWTMGGLEKEQKASILKNTRKCLKGKLALLKEG
ncbi:hypothetical protein ES695_01215 [Candidatus Atribacteria bacterium 1244-E10-H5-B2]|nr:MAG: hypothetical protein ES695_01215 [Candidatus Atribacteria bacterium 1244-E10-H5-B2]